MSRYYIITSIDDVLRTNDSVKAQNFAEDEDFIVIDTYDNTVMKPTPKGGEDNVSETIPELK